MMLIFKAQQQVFSCCRFLMEGIPVVGSTLLMVGGQGLNSLVLLMLDLSRRFLLCPLFLAVVPSVKKKKSQMFFI